MEEQKLQKLDPPLSQPLSTDHNTGWVLHMMQSEFEILEL